MVKVFKKSISGDQNNSNNDANVFSSEQSYSNSDSFVTHKELVSVYYGIKDDMQNSDNEFRLEFVAVKNDIGKLDEKFTKEFLSVKDEIRVSREESHRELIEVRNELIARFDKRFDGITSDVGTLKCNITVLQSDMETLQNDVVILKNDVAVLKEDMAAVKDYLFTKLVSDIRMVVMECFTEKGIN